MNDWNYERYRTRDRLIEYDFSIYPQVIHTAGLNSIYPWENIPIAEFSKILYKIAQQHGYTGDENELWSKFAFGSIRAGTLEDFPILGESNVLYLDSNTDNVYYFKIIPNTVNIENLIKNDIQIVNETDDSFYVYIPIRALLIEDTILNCNDD